MIRHNMIEFYLNWVNNYITVERMASDFGISVEHCQKLIDIGRDMHASQ